METTALEKLADEWREEADLLRRRGAPRQAEALESAAEDLERRLRNWAAEPLTVAEAAEESGYSERRLRELLREEAVPNAGAAGAPPDPTQGPTGQARLRRPDARRRRGRWGWIHRRRGACEKTAVTPPGALALPSISPHIEDMEEPRTALQKALDATPASIRALAREAGVDDRLLRLIRDGERNLTPAVRDALVDALGRWENRCREASEALEAAPLDPSTGDDDA